MAMENPRWRIQKIIMDKINGDGKSAVEDTEDNYEQN